jgi:hypothetical protein
MDDAVDTMVADVHGGTYKAFYNDALWSVRDSKYRLVGSAVDVTTAIAVATVDSSHLS